MIGCEAKDVQRNIYVALHDTACGDWKQFVGSAEVLNRNLILIVGHARDDESVGPESLSTHLAICESRRGRTTVASNSMGAAKDNTS